MKIIKTQTYEGQKYDRIQQTQKEIDSDISACDQCCFENKTKACENLCANLYYKDTTYWVPSKASMETFKQIMCKKTCLDTEWEPYVASWGEKYTTKEELETNYMGKCTATDDPNVFKAPHDSSLYQFWIPTPDPIIEEKEQPKTRFNQVMYTKPGFPDTWYKSRQRKTSVTGIKKHCYPYLSQVKDHADFPHVFQTNDSQASVELIWTPDVSEYLHPSKEKEESNVTSQVINSQMLGRIQRKVTPTKKSLINPNVEML